eukprot:gnl/TRDRNA2_/TRDRNA2_174884_c0_seq11.p1 gnl/TRDRNA2_/TRDRNA2_174884_c0~~gnl/TRDRNA2_/TRDRNA2_174884_c0_seq11.p1  ORF type:complete len:295 (-),score=50.46 gnl/TRDRNA2_/TRDRNA2_174884_c0_seq11:150-1034(-)
MSRSPRRREKRPSNFSYGGRKVWGSLVQYVEEGYDQYQYESAAAFEAGAASAWAGQAPAPARPSGPSTSLRVPKEIVAHLMTEQSRELLKKQCGADVEWDLDDCTVLFYGSADQQNAAMRLVQRVSTHCLWGSSEDKVMRLLKPKHAESVLVRLSPMINTLKPAEKMLSGAEGRTTLTIGKEKTNDVQIKDPIISRQHCVLEFDPVRGSVYAIEYSTNGTFLNGKRLPPRTSGKVLLSHGDEMMFKDPATNRQVEFGYVININEIAVKVEADMGSYRRSLSQEEASNGNKYFCA